MWGAGDARTRHAVSNGFTLIEMLVILAVLSLIAGLMFPAVEKALRRQAFLAAATRIDIALREARAEAVRDGRSTPFAASSDRHAFAVGRARERLPDALSLTTSRDGIVFFADGGANGGEVALVDGRDERRWRIRADTGAIERVR